MIEATLAPILQFAFAERHWTVSPQLEAMAQQLPAVAVAGIEFSLVGPGGVDLQQRIRTHQELDRLTRLVTRRGGGFPWPDLLRFCDSYLLGGDVEEVWLELDDNGAASTAPLSLFVRLPKRHTSAQTCSAIVQLHEAFDIPYTCARQIAVERCIDACPEGAKVPFLGIMLERNGSPIRLIVEDIAFEHLETYLVQAGWMGELTDDVEILYDSVDRIRLALTVDQELFLQVGFECFLGDPTHHDPRWEHILATLSELGIAKADRCAHILSWPDRIVPTTSSQPWPHVMMMDSLLREPREIGWLDCRISHIKVNHHAGRLSSAKAYLGFIEAWNDLPHAVEPCPEKPQVESNPRGLVDSIELAISYLLKERTQWGWWLDYPRVGNGASDEWVTAYVANALVETKNTRAQVAARHGWNLLTRRERDGWGWSKYTPPDADSTAWALQLATKLGFIEEERGQRALTFLRKHIQGDLGIATYLKSDENSQRFVYSEWCQTAICVTAAAAELTALGETTRECLRHAQQPDGHWQNYWWQGPCYATAHAVDALSLSSNDEDQPRVDRAVEWAGHWLGTHLLNSYSAHNPFESALALRILLCRPHCNTELIARARKSLQENQGSDGSWRSSATLEFPSATRQRFIIEDTRKVMTTATVLRTLIRLRALETEERPRTP